MFEAYLKQIEGEMKKLAATVKATQGGLITLTRQIQESGMRQSQLV